MKTTENSIKAFLQLPVKPLLATYGKLLQRIRPVIYYPYQLEQGFYIVPKLSTTDGDCDDAGLPIPPKDVWFGYGGTTEEYLNSGKEHIDKMKQILHSTDFSLEKANRILDFGCAVGRMIRWLVALADKCEIWGVDIGASHVMWCQQNLSPPFNFATVTTIPCLPFEDGYFDFIYCGSVFTHIDYLTDAWLLELRRILRIGGRIYITIHDKHTIDLHINHDRGPSDVTRALLELNNKTNLLTSEYNMFSIFPGSPRSQVFYDIDYLCSAWGRILRLISVTQEAYGVQTAVLMEK